MACCVLTWILFAPVRPLLAQTDEQANHEVDLTALSFKDLMTMEITSVSKKKEKLFTTPASVYVISSEDIRKSGHQSIPEVLRMVPGIQVAKLDSNKWAITARGFNSLYAGKLLVLIDGRSVYTPLYSGVFWDVQDLLLEDIERIEVIKGAGGTLWGANAVNGIINVITKTAQDTQGNLFTAGAGTEEKGFSSVRHGGKISDDAYYRVYAKYFSRDEAIYANGDPANDRWDALREGFRIDWDMSEQDHLTLHGDCYDGHSGKRLSLTVPPPGANFQTDNNADIRGLNISTQWNHTVSDTSEASLQFYYDRTEHYGIELGESRDTFDLDFQHHFQMAVGHNVIWGLGYRHTGDSINSSYTVSFDPASRHDELFSGFVQDEITLVADLITFIIGTKLESNNYTGSEFQPSARLLWTPNERHTMWTSFTRAVSTPSRTYDDMTLIFNSTPVMSNNPNRDLISQEVESYELGYRVKPSETLLLDLSLFYNEYNHLFTNENNPTFLTRIHGNRMRGETYGAEVSSHWQVNHRWNVTGGYSLLMLQMHTDNTSTDTSTERKIERSSPQNMVHLNSQLTLGDNLEWNALLYYVDGIPHYNIPSYTRLDMGLTWNVNDNVDIVVIGQNLLDCVHPEFNDPGIVATEVQRGVLGKVTWRF